MFICTYLSDLLYKWCQVRTLHYHPLSGGVAATIVIFLKSRGFSYKGTQRGIRKRYMLF